jgi:DNA polymerase-3 subunit delta
MAHKKAHEVEAWLRRPPENVAIVLIYGPDRGLVSERARAFADKTGLPLDDPFSVVRLDAGEAEQGRLLDEARTVPMFSSRRLLWVRNAGAQKSLADDLKVLSADPPRDAIILVEAGDLKKTAPLRTVVEGSAIGMALPCYGDEDRDIDSVIDGELAKTGMAISMEARGALRRNLGGDRLATRGEIAKLALYAHGKREIELDDVLAMTGDVSGLSVDDAVDAMLDGKVENFDVTFSRQSQNGSQAYQVLAAAIRQMQMLHLMRGGMGGGRNAAAVVASARPPVFFARRKTVERALERWSAEALQRGLARLQTAVLATRQRPELAVEIARQTLLGIAIEGSRLGSRRN